jgi:putative Mg2+ transporter-C (MgtC) family protein
MFLVASVPELAGWDVVARLAIASGLGAAVGFEREIREREAGMRTHLLVSLGAALFTIISAYGFHEFVASDESIVQMDPTRIAAQIVTGIGFLGAGAIIRAGLSVRGLTTASSLWVVAAIGMAAGAGYYSAAVAATVLTVVALWPLRLLTYRIVERLRPDEKRLVVELAPGQRLAPLLDALGEVRSIEVADETDRRIVTVDLAEPLGEHEVAAVSELDYVIGLRWTR